MTLSQRVAGLAGPDREVECRIWAALEAIPFDVALQVEPHLGQWRAPAYTASLDAAMTLVPEGATWNLGGSPKASFAGMGLYGAMVEVGIDQIHGEAATPALALASAALSTRGL